MKQEEQMGVTKIISREYFDQKIEEKYEVSENGYFIFNDVKWRHECKGFLKEGHLNAELCSKQILSFLNKYLIKRDTFTTVQDFSTILINGMCYNLQLIKDDYDLNLSHSLCINLSVIIPFFHIHVLELERMDHNFSKWNGVPARKKELENTDYKIDIINIKKFLISKLCLFEFPEELIDKKVTPILYTEDISKEDFTYFNAFFQREFYTR